MKDISVLSVEVGEALSERGLMLATAESCTGGWVAQAVTSVAGSSRWFERGFVTYANVAKQEMLGVDAKTLALFGAVSEAAVREMAAGAISHSHADIALSVSGIAGPGGGSEDKPVGTVWFGWAVKEGETSALRLALHGDRQTIRRQAVGAALEGVLKIVGHGSLSCG